MATDNDSYYSIDALAEGIYKEKMSRFLAFAVPVSSVEEAMEQVTRFQKSYYDARHVCWAYRMGVMGDIFRVNDNGEPSGTAGKPILGQLISRNLSNVLVVVVRYFGGIKLGTGGLVVAYREAAASALDRANVIECMVEEEVIWRFDYSDMNRVMRIIKELNVTVMEQYFEERCVIKLKLRKSLVSQLRNRLSTERD